MNGKRTAKETRNLLLSICAVLIVTLILLIFMLSSMNNNHRPGKPSADNTTTVPSQDAVQVQELLVEDVKEQDDFVVVDTSYCVIKYPYAFSDLIHVASQTFDNYSQLDFSAVVGSEERVLYTLLFNKDEGIPVGTLTVNGAEYRVAAVIYELDDVSEDHRVTFYAAQETFNDVMVSLAENPGFTAAQ